MASAFTDPEWKASREGFVWIHGRLTELHTAARQMAQTIVTFTSLEMAYVAVLLVTMANVANPVAQKHISMLMWTVGLALVGVLFKLWLLLLTVKHAYMYGSTYRPYESRIINGLFGFMARALAGVDFARPQAQSPSLIAALEEHTRGEKETERLRVYEAVAAEVDKKHFQLTHLALCFPMSFLFTVASLLYLGVCLFIWMAGRWPQI